jgi:transcriptional regulator with XRE-family HTH domain
MDGKDIKKKLLGAGFYPSMIAEKLNISHQAMSARLATSDVKLSFLYELCKITGLDLSYFIDMPAPADVNSLLKIIKNKDEIIVKQAEEIGRLKEKLAKSK